MTAISKTDFVNAERAASGIRTASCREPSRIAYLDSLRGLAALYVVAGHAALDLRVQPLTALGLLSYGRLAVALFIVLSGYCLMLPVARTGEDRIPYSFLKYIRRRARRIYPPYLAAMAISLAVLAMLPSPVASRSHWFTTFLPAFGWQNLTAHLVMLHNLNNDWIYKINAPFWSVATEWQIYFIFPLVLLPVGRRIGHWAIVPIGLSLGLLPILVFHRFETAAPWFIGLFAMGMTSATIGHSPGATATQIRSLPIWGWAFGISAMLGIGALWRMRGTGMNWKDSCGTEIAFGTIFALMLIWLASSAPRARISGAAKGFLLSKPLLALGACSYSLYLIHGVAVSLSSIGMSYLLGGVAPWVGDALGLLAGIVVSLVAVVPFYLAFERPFLNHPQGRRRELGQP